MCGEEWKKVVRERNETRMKMLLGNTRQAREVYSTNRRTAKTVCRQKKRILERGKL